jgi:hypothetical protein
MAEVSYGPEHWKGAPTNGTEPPDNGGMEHRVTALESRLDAVLPTLATKSDIGEMRAEFKGWTLTTALTLVGTMLAGFIGVATIVLRQPMPSAQAQQPIIINVPAPQQIAPPAPSPNKTQ